MRLPLVGVVCVLAVVAGCGDSDNAADSDPKQCMPGTGSPIDEETFKQAFAAEGITLYRDDRCLPNYLVSLSNYNVSFGDEYEAITARQGSLLCEIYPETYGSSNRILRYVWLNDRTPTHVNVLNVGCGVFAERTEQTDAVERAFRRLPGVSERATTVPGADAVHD